MTTGAQSALADDSFNDVFDRDSGADTAAPVADAGVSRDDQGRFAPKSEPAPDAQKTAPPEQQQATPETPDERNTNRHVPLSELLAERERFKKEKSLREELERRATEHEQRAKMLEQMFQQQVQQRPQAQVQQPEPEAIPDPYADPEGFARYQQREQFLARRHDIANMSEAIARRTYGDKIVDEAAEAAFQAGVARAFFEKAKDPFGELIDWHKKQSAFQRIGPDPDAYEKSVEAKLREKILAELKAGGTAPKPNFPGSLADATATGSGGQHLTDQAIADELFSPTRNRRA